MRYVLIKLIFLILIVPVVGLAQNPTTWSLESLEWKIESPTGPTIKSVPVRLRVSIEAGWHLYDLDQSPGGPIPTTVKVSDGSPFEIIGKIKSQKPQIKPDPNFTADGKSLETRFFENETAFDLVVRATRDEVYVNDLSFDVRFQLCNDTFCLPPGPSAFHLLVKPT